MNNHFPLDLFEALTFDSKASYHRTKTEVQLEYLWLAHDLDQYFGAIAVGSIVVQ